MPAFNTGDANWDQGLGSLSQMLFPDPSKIAQAGYYGAESRKARVETDVIERKEKALQDLFKMMHPHGPPTAQVPGVMDPGNSFAVQPPLQGAPMGQPSTTLPGMMSQAMGQAPGQGAGPVLSRGVMLNGMLPGGEGNLDPTQAANNWSTFEVSQEGIPKHYILPTQPGDQPPSGDGITMGSAVDRYLKTGQNYGAFDSDETAAAFMGLGRGEQSAPGGRPMPSYEPGTATQLANAVMSNGIQPGGLGAGTPPPMASPAPNSGAPAAPTTTGSSGGTPPTDLGSGVFHPASMTQPGGGIKQSGPAAPNGAPAGALDLTPIIVQAMAAGYSGEDVVNVGAAYLDEALQAGIIDKNTYAQQLASLNRTGALSSQTQIANQNIVTGETARQFNQGRVPIVRDDGSLGAVPQDEWYPHYNKYDVLDPSAAGALATQNYSPTSVFTLNPDGTPDYTRSETVTNMQAIRDHRTRTTADFKPQGVTSTDTTGAEEGGFQREFLANQAVEKAYAPTPRQAINDFSRQEPAALTPQAKRAVMDRANQIWLNDPQLRTDQKNYPLAVDRAIASLQQEGLLPTTQAITEARARGLVNIGGSKPILGGQDPALMNGADGKLKFKVDLIGAQPGPSGQPQPQGQAPSPAPSPEAPQAASGKLPGPQAPIPLRRSGIPGPGWSPPRGPAPQAGAPGASSVAQPGAQGAAKEGDVSVTPQGVPLIMRNGAYVPLSPAEMQRYRAAHPQRGVAGQ